MPDIRDLHNAFAELEREVPDFYRSPVVAERLQDILGQSDVRTRTTRPNRGWPIATALLAAAAVAAIAVAAVSLSTHSSTHGQVGHQSTVSNSISVPPSPSTQHSSPVTQSSSTHSTPKAGAMPATRAALIAYVNGVPGVTATDYEQSSPGPGQAMRPTPGIAEFNTPSGNITCGIIAGDPGGGANVTCQAQQFTFPIPPKPASCQMDWASYFGFVKNGLVKVGACVGGPELDPTTKVLAYGSSIELAGISCRSESGFLACADLTTGHGFAVNRDTIKKY